MSPWKERRAPFGLQRPFDQREEFDKMIKNNTYEIYEVKQNNGTEILDTV